MEANCSRCGANITGKPKVCISCANDIKTSTEKAAPDLLEALSKIKSLSEVDTGQTKAPSKQDYINACLSIHREAQAAI